MNIHFDTVANEAGLVLYKNRFDIDGKKRSSSAGHTLSLSTMLKFSALSHLKFEFACKSGWGHPVLGGVVKS